MHRLAELLEIWKEVGVKIAMTHVDLPNQAKGGVAHQVHYLSNALVERGHDVTLFSFSPAFDECRYAVRQLPAPMKLRKLWSFLFAAALARVDFTGFDVIHSNGDNYLLRGRHPQIRTFYGSAKDEAQSAVRLRRKLYQIVISWLEQASTRVADVNVGISEATRARIPAITTIVPCGVDIQRFRPGAKSPHPALLFVGTTGGRKRGAFLADIFQREVRPRFPDAELWAVAEKPMEGEGIRNFGRVSLDVLTDLYQRAWVFSLPSSYEGFGVPYIEALAAGTPVVASPNPGAREVLREGEFGLLPEDAQLGAAINQLLGDAALRESFVGNGLVRAQDFSWDSVTAQYVKLYTDLMTGRQPRKADPTPGHDAQIRANGA